ncbi:MAG: hypothetical protein ACTSPY_10320 [Candidatus Helarchaeota archaeon]
MIIKKFKLILLSLILLINLFVITSIITENKNQSLKNKNFGINNKIDDSFINNNALIGNWPINHPLGNYIDIFIENNLAFIAAQQGGLLIFNISNPDNITFIGNFELFDRILSVDIKNNYAYIGSESVGLIILDISNLSAPINISQFYTNGTSHAVRIFNNTAFICDGSAGIVLVNISNPYLPSFISTYDTLGVSYDIDIDINKKIAYVADGPNGMVLLNISNLENLEFISKIDTNDSAQDIYVENNYTYIADLQMGLTIFDVSIPTSPKYENNFNTNGSAYGLNIFNDLVFIADGNDGIVILNISNIHSLQLLNHFKLNNSRSIWYSNNLLYIADYGYGLYILDISNLSSTFIIGSYKLSGEFIDIKASDNLLYILNSYLGLQIFNISNINNIKLIATFPLNESGRSLELINGLVLITVRNEGLFILNVSDPYNPFFVRKISISNPYGITIYNNYYVYVANGGVGFILVDIFIPNLAYIVNSFNPTGVGFCYDVEIYNHYLFVSDGDNGLFVYDITVPSNPIFISKFESDKNSIEIKIIENTLFLIDYPNSVKIINISILSNLTLIYNYNISSFCNDLVCSNSYLFISDWEQGVFFLNIMNISAPILLNLTKTLYPNGLTLNNGYLYLADVQYLYIFVAPPEKPDFFPITPNITYNGLVYLSWEKIDSINNYKIYRSNSPITDLDNLDPIIIISGNNYTDHLINYGTYYYAIIANNIWGNSPISTVRIVTFYSQSPGFNWFFFTLIIILISVIIGSVALNLRYYYILKIRKTRLTPNKKLKNKSLIEKLEYALKGHDRKNQFIKNFKNLLSKDSKNITLNRITRSWTQHYTTYFMQKFGLPKEGAEIRAAQKKEQEIQELYERLKNIIKIQVKKLKFGKYAGTKSYKIIIDEETNIT